MDDHIARMNVAMGKLERGPQARNDICQALAESKAGFEVGIGGKPLLQSRAFHPVSHQQ